MLKTMLAVVRHFPVHAIKFPGHVPYSVLGEDKRFTIGELQGTDYKPQLHRPVAFPHE